MLVLETSILLRSFPPIIHVMSITKTENALIVHGILRAYLFWQPSLGRPDRFLHEAAKLRASVANLNENRNKSHRCKKYPCS